MYIARVEIPNRTQEQLQRVKGYILSNIYTIQCTILYYQ